LAKTAKTFSIAQDRNNVMGNYIKREPIGGEIYKSQEIRVVEKIVEKDVDIAILAEAMAKALLIHFPLGMNGQQRNGETLKDSHIGDTFNDSKTLESLAKSMLVSRNETESNMGSMDKNIVITKNDNKETDNTIDLLSGLED
jgi:hypothetical protein